MKEGEEEEEKEKIRKAFQTKLLYMKLMEI